MLCTSGIFVMLLELTLATCFAPFNIYGFSLVCTSGTLYKSLTATPDNARKPLDFDHPKAHETQVSKLCQCVFLCSH